MAYSEQDRVWIREFVGYGAIFRQAEPRLESAITATQSIADKGSQPDSSTENYIKGILYGVAEVVGQEGVTPGGTAQNVTFSTPAIRGLLEIRANIARLDALLGISSADGKEVEIDPAREMTRLRNEGRVQCHKLARMLGMKGVRADMFSSSPVVKDSEPFVSDDYARPEPWRFSWPSSRNSLGRGGRGW